LAQVRYASLGFAMPYLDVIVAQTNLVDVVDAKSQMASGDQRVSSAQVSVFKAGWRMGIGCGALALTDAGAVVAALVPAAGLVMRHAPSCGDRQTKFDIAKDQQYEARRYLVSDR